MIRLFNSLTQRKEEFVPRTPGKAGIYVCGPTVYNLVHVGNARPYVTFAVLRNWLRRRGLEATLVENITDVDDKIIVKAGAEGRSAAQVAAEFTAAYHADMGRLGDALRPDVEPLATATIPEIIDLCCQLVAAGHAYEAEGSVYFRVRSFPQYGKLSRQRIEELEEGARVAGEPGKQDALDFAVWKAAKPGEPAWESPWGMGRPGWHIECSAMAIRYLGAGFDVHGGGRDLIFPHHENEIAQSEAAGVEFARVWMHNGMIRNEGEKMAKSVGNIFLLREVLDRYPAAVVLTYFLTTHYRSPLEFSVEKLEEARAAHERLDGAVRDIDFRVANADKAARRGHAPELAARAEKARAAFAEHMDDDLNTAAALGELFALVADTHRAFAAIDQGEAPLDTAALAAVRAALVDSLAVLAIELPAAGAGADAAATSATSSRSAVGGTAEPGEVCITGDLALPPAQQLAAEQRWEDLELLYAERLACGDASYACVLRDHRRANQDWVASDRLRDQIQAAGFEVRDTKQGTQVVPKG
jgi:cysteinyl-tRNA synthetase